jgi:hypothetical protein
MLMNEYLAFSTVCTILFLLWVRHRIFHPFECTCGYKTHFSGRFKKHVLQSHKWH